MDIASISAKVQLKSLRQPEKARWKTLFVTLGPMAAATDADGHSARLERSESRCTFIMIESA